MNIKTLLLASAAAVALPIAASAATLAGGVYDAIDYNGNRSIWTPGKNTKKLVNGAGSLWSFSGGTFAFNDAIGNAVLKATATNTSDDNLTFDVNLRFDLDDAGYGAPGNAGYCQFSGVDKGCTNGPYAADPANWDYFDFLSGTFTGTGALAGVVWDISDNLMHKAQAGVGANALETGDNGFSMWFLFTEASGSALVDSTYVDSKGYAINASGNGDVNIDLSDQPTGGPLPTPLPAGAVLLLAGLGAMGALRRKA